MKRYVLMFVATVLLVAANAPEDEAAKKELKKLEGTWTLVSGEQDGKPLPEQTLKTARLVIVGDKHTVKVGADTIIGTHKLDPNKTPKQIDAMDTEGPYKGKTPLGIYKLEGEQFTVCFAPPDKDRPKEFTTRSGTGTLLHVWKREKK